MTAFHPLVTEVGKSIVLRDDRPVLPPAVLASFRHRLARVEGSEQRILAAHFVGLARAMFARFAARAAELVEQLAILAATVLHDATLTSDAFLAATWDGALASFIGGRAAVAEDARPKVPAFSALALRVAVSKAPRL